MQTKYQLQLWGKRANGPNAMRQNCVYFPSHNIHMVYKVKVIYQSTQSAVLPRSVTSKLDDSCWNQLLNAVTSCLLSILTTSEFFCLAVNPVVSEAALSWAAT